MAENVSRASTGAVDPDPGRRLALDNALTEVFLTHGYEGATLTQLALASGLSKASLYHHYPGGKQEMARVLLSRAVQQLQARAFDRLGGKKPPEDRLCAFFGGFADYCAGDSYGCLLSVLGQSAHADFQDLVSRQFDTWTARLANVYAELTPEVKPKRAQRTAEQTLVALYGAMTMARLTNQPKLLERTVKRLSKTVIQAAETASH